MKKLMLLFILLSLPTYAEEETYFEKVSYAYDTYYFGVPMFYHGGLGYQKNDFRMILPYVGVGFNPVSGYGYDVYSGFSLNYRDFSFDARAVQQVGTWKDGYGLSYGESLNTYGLFTATQNFQNIKATFNLEVGSTQTTNLDASGQLTSQKSLTVKPSLHFVGMIYDDTLSRIGYESSLLFEVLPKDDIQTFHIKTYAPMNFTVAYGWLGLNVMPGFEYKDFIKGQDSGYQLSTPVELYKSLQFFTDYAPNYQFTASVSTELRFYFKFLENVAPGASKMFASFIGTVGYGSTFDQTPATGDLIYQYSGGIGYNLFDSAAFLLNAGADQNNEVFLNISVISPLELTI